jgi:hypothetical protein
MAAMDTGDGAIMADRLPPHNIELEQALLGAVLVKNAAYRQVSDLLRPEHFFNPLHRTLYETAGRLIDAGQDATPVTIGAHLPADTNKVMVGDRPLKHYIAQLATEAVSVFNPRGYAEDIVDHAARREIIRVAQDAAAAAYDGADPDLAEKARTAFGEIAKTRGPSNIRFELTPFSALKSDPKARTYLIKGLLPRQGLVVVWGPPKCGKSFWIFDAMMHVAIGRGYRRHRVMRGEVIYLALEGQAGFGDRKEAFCKRFMQKDDPAPTFKLCGASLDLVCDHAKLISDISMQSSAPACVVIDTLNRSFTGSESSDEDMTAYVRAADAVQRAFDCAVVIVHHCGVNGERPRGHTSLTGAADVQISIRKDDAGIITTKIEYAKDMPEGAIFASRLEVEKLGIDPDGDDITSCVVTAIDAEELPATPAPRRQRAEPITTREFRASFAEALDACGQQMRIRNDGPTVRAVETRHVGAEFNRRHATGNADPKKRADAQRKAFERCMKSLPPEYATCVQDDREWIWQLAMRSR